MKAVLDHVQKKLLPEFYKSFTTPQEFEWRNFLEMVRKLQAERVTQIHLASKTQNQNGNVDKKEKKPKHWSLPFQNILNSE